MPGVRDRASSSANRPRVVKAAAPNAMVLRKVRRLEVKIDCAMGKLLRRERITDNLFQAGQVRGQGTQVILADFAAVTGHAGVGLMGVRIANLLHEPIDSVFRAGSRQVGPFGATSSAAHGMTATT